MNAPHDARGPVEPGPWRTISLVASLLGLASLLAWPVGVFMSFFFFDAPGSENNRLLLALAWSLWSYGPVALLSAVAALVLRWRRRSLAGSVVGSLWLLHALVVVGLFVALQVVCGGNFRC